MDDSAAFEKRCQVLQDPSTGRYVVATEPIKEGEVLLLERPVLLLPMNGDKRCANCFKLTQQHCTKCKIFSLCAECSKHNEFDCEFLAKLQPEKVQLLQQHADIYGPLKCLLLNENPETREYFVSFLKMKSHLEERRNSNVWLEYEKNIAEPMLKAKLDENFVAGLEITGELIQQMCAILDVNCFEVRARDKGAMRGCYLRGALFNHDCVANTTCAVDDQYRMKFYANRYIAKDENVTTCYVNVLLGTEERRHILQAGKHFHCMCKRCEDPTELNSHMSSFLCGKCAAANRENGFIVKQPQDQIWKCLQCDSTLKPEYVQSLLDRAKEEMFHAKEDIYHYELLMAKLSRILHRNHYLMVDIKQNVAAILRTILQNMVKRPGRKVYERKVRLCHEILAVLRIVQPGVSRLKGIVLYELSNTAAEMHRMCYTDKELSAEQLVEQLQKCELLTREAIRNLIYEPVNTPEGMLTKCMLKEVKDLQTDIKELQQKQENANQENTDEQQQLPQLPSTAKLEANGGDDDTEEDDDEESNENDEEVTSSEDDVE